MRRVRLVVEEEKSLEDKYESIFSLDPETKKGQIVAYDYKNLARVAKSHYKEKVLKAFDEALKKQTENYGCVIRPENLRKAIKSCFKEEL